MPVLAEMWYLIFNNGTYESKQQPDLWHPLIFGEQLCLPGRFQALGFTSKAPELELERDKYDHSFTLNLYDSFSNY